MFTRQTLALSISAALPLFSWAQEAQPVFLDTIFVQTQRNYDALASEKTRDYASPAATVGTKIPATLTEIPQSISIITQQQIKDRNVDTFDQLARKTPGLRVLSNDDGRSSVYARGYEYDEANIDGLTAPMQSINGTLPNLVAFDRVEVMRGPSGLFDSSGEMGGIVNLVRKRPTEDFQASVEGAYGTQKAYRVSGDISGALSADGSVRGRVIAQTSGKSPKPAKQNNHHETVYAALDWDLAPTTTLGFGYLFQQRHITPDNGYATYTNGSLLKLPQNVFMGANWNEFTMKSHDFFVDGKHYFSNGGFGKFGLRYSDREADSNYAFGGGGINPRTNTVNATGLATDIKQKSFAADVSYSQPFSFNGRENEFVVGADYNHSDRDYDQARMALASNLDYRRFASLPYSDIMATAKRTGRGYSRTETEQDEYGLYGKVRVRATDNLSVIAGGRLGHYKIDSLDSGVRNSRSDSFFTGYAGLTFDIDDQNSLYASYSSLYRPQTEVGTDSKLLKPRKGSQYEVGYKGSYLDDKLQTRVSLYRLQDENAAASIVGNSSQYAALGKRVMQGVETEISGEITPQWRIHAGYSYLDSNIKVGSTTRDDGIFLLMPRHSFNLWTSYDITDQFTLGGGVNAMSDIKSSQGVRGAGYATMDLMAAYRFTPKLQAQINVDNVFNRHYYTRVGAYNTFNIAGAERSVMANIRYDF